jgi:serine/threonine protein kinase
VGKIYKFVITMHSYFIQLALCAVITMGSHFSVTTCCKFPLIIHVSALYLSTVMQVTKLSMLKILYDPEGGSLADQIENNKKLGEVMSEEGLTLLLLQLVEGLKYIHSLNLVHMDIKPGNLL